MPLEEIYEQATNEYTVHEGGQESATQKTIEMAAITKPDQVKDKPGYETPIKKIELRHYGTELLTRDAGTAIRADIAGYIAAGYNIEISLDDVSDITPSVADEAFAKLAEIIGNDVFEQKVTFTGGSQLANRLVSFVLKTRQSRGHNI